MRRCRNCEYWERTQQWKGNCRKHPWPRNKFSEDATATECRDYEDRHVKLMTASSKEVIR